jgi:hypothetical protein
MDVDIGMFGGAFFMKHGFSFSRELVLSRSTVAPPAWACFVAPPVSEPPCFIGSLAALIELLGFGLDWPKAETSILTLKTVPGTINFHRTIFLMVFMCQL